MADGDLGAVRRTSRPDLSGVTPVTKPRDETASASKDASGPVIVSERLDQGAGTGIQDRAVDPGNGTGDLRAEFVSAVMRATAGTNDLHIVADRMITEGWRPSIVGVAQVASVVHTLSVLFGTTNRAHMADYLARVACAIAEGRPWPELEPKPAPPDTETEWGARLQGGSLVTGMKRKTADEFLKGCPSATLVRREVSSWIEATS